MPVGNASLWSTAWSLSLPTAEHLWPRSTILPWGLPSNPVSATQRSRESIHVGVVLDQGISEASGSMFPFSSSRWTILRHIWQGSSPGLKWCLSRFHPLFLNFSPYFPMIWFHLPAEKAHRVEHQVAFMVATQTQSPTLVLVSSPSFHPHSPLLSGFTVPNKLPAHSLGSLCPWGNLG